MYYISEININNEKAKEFFKIPIKNLDISFNSDLNTLDYKDYCFSGIPIPKNIKKEIQGQYANISWDVDNFRSNEYDIRKIKYLLEVKNGDKFYSKETAEKRMSLNIYNLNNNYELKIRTFIGDIQGNWSEIKSFQNQVQSQKQTNSLFGNSNIVMQSNKNPFSFTNSFY